MKIALIHDWLRVHAGSEKVVSEILSMYKHEDMMLYTLFNKLSIEEQAQILHNAPCRTSWIQFVPFVNRIYKVLLPLMPFVIGHMRIRSSDIYLSSSHAIAKGFRHPKDKLHICYCHTPMRYAWYLNEDYLQEFSGIKLWLIKWILPFIRRWDLRSATHVNEFIANSKHIQYQIRNIYKRESVVIYPPVNTKLFKLNPNPRQSFYLAVGRCVPYKKMDMIIRAFNNMPDKKLVLIGDGYDSKRVKGLMKNSTNIVWLGYQHDDELILYMQNARACIFAAKEDFGIMCVEAQATGTPVLALKYGGYLETVAEGLSGYFFEEQTVESIMQAVNYFEQNPLCDHAGISAHAAFFSAEKFREAFGQFVHAKHQAFMHRL
ncbi:MAG: glycosyltransferase [Chitinophagaceae bacterium]|nr:glycosyltransferase [Chitinophagaceae bacterium]